MANVEVWPTVHEVRRSLAADLSALTEQQWATPSMCAGWTVRDALAHMTGTAKLTAGSFVAKFVTSGFNITKMQDKDIAVERGTSGADALARFRAVETSTAHPPGPIDSWLGEALVHAEDIRRPLGLVADYPMAALEQAADFYAGSNILIGTKKRIAGVRLRATDSSWTHGDGPEAAGPMRALLSAMTGRKPALADLTGPGVDVLAGRD